MFKNRKLETWSNPLMVCAKFKFQKYLIEKSLTLIYIL